MIIRDSRSPRGRTETDYRQINRPSDIPFPVAGFTQDGRSGTNWKQTMVSADRRPAAAPLAQGQRPKRYVVLRCDGCRTEFKREIRRGVNNASARHWCSKNCRSRTQMRERYVPRNRRARPMASCHPDRPHKALGLCQQCYGAKLKRETRLRKAAQ